MSDEKPRSIVPLIAGVVAVLVMLVLGALGLFICLPIVGLTVLGNELDRSFNEVSRELEQP